MTMDVADDLTCHELVELVTDYLEDALAPAERARLEAHLDLCRGCREYLAQMRQTISVMGGLPPDSLDPQMRDQLLQVFREWRRSR
jgi:anti-sigma factor RsiW